METKRYVKKLMSVFDLSDCEMMHFPEKMSGRVMLLYDEDENTKEFKLLGNSISEKTRGSITSWLEDHFEIEDLSPC